MEYFEKLYSSKLENLENMDKFLDAYDFPKITQKDVNHLHGPIICNEIESLIKCLPKNEKPRTRRIHC
jgi:hypothetical protein